MYEWHPLLGIIGQFIELGGNIKIGRHVAIVHIIGNVNTFSMFLMHFLFFFVFFEVVILIKKFLLPIPMFCILFPIFLNFQNYIKLSLLWWHEHLFHHLNLLHHNILGDFFLFSVGLICKFCDLLLWHVFKVVIFFNLCVLVYSICSCCCLLFKFNMGNKFLERFFMFNVLIVALLTKMSFNNYKPTL